jgi:hypothetical protein
MRRPDRHQGHSSSRRHQRAGRHRHPTSAPGRPQRTSGYASSPSCRAGPWRLQQRPDLPCSPGTGQHHDGPRTSSPSRSHVTAGTASTTPIPFQELNQLAGAFQPRGPAGVPRSGLGAPSDRHSAPATAPVAPTGESGDTAGAATSSPRRSPSTSECPGTGDPGTQRAQASLVHGTAHTDEASRRIVSTQPGPSDSRSKQPPGKPANISQLQAGLQVSRTHRPHRRRIKRDPSPQQAGPPTPAPRSAARQPHHVTIRNPR